MSKLIIPKGYKTALGLYDTQTAIGILKRTFEEKLCLALNLKRVSAPLFVDPDTGFISHKSKNGRELKAMELPGLWNGAMSDWNTIFVEVPLITFNPVKTVNDLLRDVHM